jgi:hypothetical protein
MCMLGVNGDYLGKAPSSGYAGYTLGIGDNGIPAWIPNVPQMRNGHFHARTSPGTGINQYILKSGNGGSNAEAVTTGKYPGSIAHSTGTNTNGYAGRQYVGSAGFSLGASAGTWYYECVFRIPTLSDGTDTFAIAIGPGDSQTTADHTNGVYLRYSSATNGGKFELVTFKSGSSTKTDTGVTAAANTWYHALIVITNASSASLYLVTDGSNLGSAVATNTTNIPDSSGLVMGFNTIILKSAGTNARTLEVCYELGRRQTPFTPTEAVRWSHPGRMTMGDGAGIATGDIAAGLHLNRNTELIWNAINSPNDMHRYNAEEVLGLGGEFADSPSLGQGSSRTRRSTAGLHHGVADRVGCVRCGIPDSGPDVHRRGLGDGHLRRGVLHHDAVDRAQKHTVRLGLLGATNGSSDGIFLSIDSDADTEAQFITKAGGTSDADGHRRHDRRGHELPREDRGHQQHHGQLLPQGGRDGSGLGCGHAHDEHPERVRHAGRRNHQGGGATGRSLRVSYQTCQQRMASIGTGLG